ncbi:chromate transporter-domain-containing protein [Gymnopilus junonius]|uniref:Chromate transporter-domain-containing protein n=1 Tax=Gymnopilus junonius TaxID=109634 RepID=A0A9P5P4X2_GYMJU|nr:chromate transporter-domain-containing protein [Gymnopilus junonius]
MSTDPLVHAPLLHTAYRTFSEDDSDLDPPYQTNTSKLSTRLLDVLSRTFDLGLTAFGGPPVHFHILHRRFVDGLGNTPWIDEQTYQELFAVTQALPGPASTKMLFNIAQIHAGMIPALFVFFMWSFPGSVAMYTFSLGVQHLGERLPEPVYALLSGLNAAIVGLIALAAVQLARKAITDPITRILVVGGACAGMCYNALWYFPVLLVVGGLVTLAWDFGRASFRRLSLGQIGRHRRHRSSVDLGPQVTPSDINDSSTEAIREELRNSGGSGPHRRQILPASAESGIADNSTNNDIPSPARPVSRIERSGHAIPAKVGIMTIIAFLAAFIVFLSLRALLRHTPLLFSLFNSMFLAGTIIFGGGPVVIPLLRDYVVEPGWVSPRDFLLGLAVIQALPGPNFNFAVYLGAMPHLHTRPLVIHRVPERMAVFAKEKRSVYRLWEIGYLTAKSSQGISLGEQPWWLVVATSTFTAVEWFAVPAPLAIVTGGIGGLGWWGAVGRHLN